MRIPAKFINKHAFPGETGAAAGSRLKKAFLEVQGAQESPADALQRLDKMLLKKAVEKEIKQRESWLG